MAVIPESKYFKFILVSDKPKSSLIAKNDFTEKPNDKDNMSTKSLPSAPNNNEKPELKNKTAPEVKIHASQNDDNKGENQNDKENKPSRNAQNGLVIKVPSRSTSPQLVSSPIEIMGGKKTIEPSVSPVSTSPKLVSPNPLSSNFKGPDILKKLGKMMKNSNSSDKVNIQSTSPNTTSEHEDAVVSDSTVQTQREVQQTDADNATPKPSAIDINENAADAAKSAEVNDENREEETPKTDASIPRSNSINKFVNMKLFITRTSTALVEKLKEEFDELDKRIYPEIDADDEAELSRSSNIEQDEREQLLENKDSPSLPSKDVVTNGISQTTRTHDVLAEVGVALHERKEKLENMAHKTEDLSNKASSFADMARQLREQQEKKSKSWKFW